MHAGVVWKGTFMKTINLKAQSLLGYRLNSANDSVRPGARSGATVGTKNGGGGGGGVGGLFDWLFGR